MGWQRVGHLFSRGVRLRCPRCGIGKLFYGLFSMHTHCPTCNFQFEREQGYFVGAIYINYAATAVIVYAGFLALEYFTAISLKQQLLLWGTVSIFFPLGFFRYSRSLWLSIDYIFNPADLPHHHHRTPHR